jgi:hypothetical protein
VAEVGPGYVVLYSSRPYPVLGLFLDLSIVCHLSVCLSVSLVSPVRLSVSQPVSQSFKSFSQSIISVFT